MNTLAINITDNITLSEALLMMGASLLTGLAFAAFYYFTKKKQGIDNSFLVSLILLPVIVSVVMMLVSNDIVKAFSLGGVFALIRFKTKIKDVKDAIYLLAVSTAGFACGLGYNLFGILIAAFILLVLAVLYFLKIGQPKSNVYRLKILVPENLDYVNLFNSTFEKFLKEYKLKRAKVSDFGTLMELTYIVTMNNPDEQKAFIDELRTKNGNLNIVLADDYERIAETSE